MTTAYLDCEFNGFNGSLISLALFVDEDNYFYEVLSCREPIPWVKANVIPVLNKHHIPLEEFKYRLETFINKYNDLTIVADWPDDIKYFCEALIIAPGVSINTPKTLTFSLMRVDAPSSVPHNALADAIGIKRYIESNAINK